MFINVIFVILRLYSVCSEFKEFIKLWCYKLGLIFLKLLICLKVYIGVMFVLFLLV